MVFNKKISFIRKSLFKNNFSHFSIWKKVTKPLSDPSREILNSYLEDKDPRKINLATGVYRSETSNPIVLESVTKAKELLHELKLGYNYVGIEGFVPFINSALKLGYGNNFIGLEEKRVAAVQTLGATGGFRLAIDFIKKNLESDVCFYLSKPALSMHYFQLKNANVHLYEYEYYDKNINKLDFQKVYYEILKAPERSIIIFQVCGHNPTGSDLNYSQWNSLKEILVKKKHIAMLDLSYQGFASGDIDQDSHPVKILTEENIPIILIQSFTKNFFLFGQRIGCLSFVCQDEKTAQNIVSQLKCLIRRNYSYPPIYGAQIVDTIINNNELFSLWKNEIKSYHQKVDHIRKFLIGKLKKSQSKHEWSYLEEQRGLYAYTDLKKDQIKKLEMLHHIYISSDGRINLLGLNNKNSDYFIKSLESVTR